MAGWVHRRRDHGGLIFIDLRDRSGLLQLVFHPQTAPEAHERAHGLRAEDVITATGTVARREPENVNPELPTGEVELEVAEFELLGDADTPPFPIDEEGPVDELTRLRHRALDLRRAHPRDRLLLRDRVAQTMRRTLGEQDFVEIETPILTRSTPEGARDFLVPSRVQPGQLLRAPAVAAAVQAAADGRRLRALLPARARLPRRGPAGRPPARVHPARPRDVVRGGGRRDRA